MSALAQVAQLEIEIYIFKGNKPSIKRRGTIQKETNTEGRYKSPAPNTCPHLKKKKKKETRKKNQTPRRGAAISTPCIAREAPRSLTERITRLN